ncbi:MAG TPA: hypothetical protein VNS09_21010 [Solirubrobacter sp.]|nr:hypothetical protein [Solirubrobacter sp.]
MESEDVDEVVDGLPVMAEEAGAVEERRTGGSVVTVPAVQVAALAATGFVAGAATVAVVSRHRTKKAARKRKRGISQFGEIVSSNSFLIDVHLLRRD